MSGFGSFMEGFAGGAKSMSDLQSAKEERKYRKAVRERIKMDTMDRDADRQEMGGLDPFQFEEEESPYLLRLGESLKSGFQEFKDKVSRREEEALPGVGETDFGAMYAEQNPLLGSAAADFGEIALRDGGAPPEGYGDYVDDEPNKSSSGRPKYNADSPEEAKARAARARASTNRPSPEVPPENKVDWSEGKPKKGAIPDSRTRMTQPKTKVGGAVGGALAAKLAADSLGTAWDNATDGDAKLAEYYRRIGRPGGESKGTPLGNTAVRAMGVLQDIGEKWIPDSWEEKLGLGYLKENQPTEAVPTEAPEPMVGSPRRGGGPGPSKGKLDSRPAPAPAPSQAIPSAPVPADPLAGFDVSKADPSQIPRMSTQEWQDHRAKLIRSYVRSGKSGAEAEELADQQVVAQQRRGFLHFGQQAAALAASGNLKGAGAAVVAAFQNLPTSTDVNVTIYNGHLIAYGIDEQTGEQVGQPVVLTAERIQDIMRNFADPKVWQEYALDSRKMDQGDRELGQNDRRLDLMGEQNDIDRITAEARMIDAQGGALGGIGPKDTARVAARIENGAAMVASKAADEGVDQPTLIIALQKLAMAEYRRQGGRKEPEDIFPRLLEVVSTPGGAQYLINAAKGGQ